MMLVCELAVYFFPAHHCILRVEQPTQSIDVRKRDVSSLISHYLSRGWLPLVCITSYCQLENMLVLRVCFGTQNPVLAHSPFVYELG